MRVFVFLDQLTKKQYLNSMGEKNMSDTTTNRICKKCLLKDFPDAEYFTHLYEYINNLDEEIKVNEVEYERRLEICITCPDYYQGMCRVCGCFVELRAAIRENNCAAPKMKW